VLLDDTSMHLFDFLFPRHSLLGTEGERITPEERKRMILHPIRLHREVLRQKGIKALDCLIAAGSYRESPLLQKAVKTFKYGRVRELGTELGSRMATCLPRLLHLPPSKSDANSPPPTLVPVPLHRSRLSERGFNQAEILARVVSKQRGWPIDQLLYRARDTGHQAWRKREERLTSMADAFWYIGSLKPPQTVIVIDDIATTCATLQSCALTLKAAGVKNVVGLVIAYG
jgi:predicted amidophosphoribosyltransferase